MRFFNKRFLCLSPTVNYKVIYDNDIRLIVNHLTVDVTIFPIVETFYRIRQKQASRKKFFSLVSSKIDPLRLKDRVFNKILSAANNLGHFEFSEI